MRRLAGLLLLLAAAGCSTAPLADALDCVCPPRMPPANTCAFGGVGIPQAAPPPGVSVQPVPVVPTVPPQ